MTQNTFVADPALASHGSMLVNQIEVDQKTLPTTDGSLLQVTITNMEGEHETCTVTARLSATDVEAMKDKTIAFTYGPRNNLGTFYGYVVSILASKAFQQDGTYDMQTFGTTHPLQEGKPRFYHKKTGPQIVADIVTGHGLGVQVDEHSFVWPTYAQTDQTDWAMIKALAADIGMVLYNHNGVVRLVDPMRLVTDSGPVLRLIRGDEALDRSRQVLDFMPESRSLTEADLVVPVFGFFDNDRVSLSKPLSSTNRLMTGAPTLNRQMAQVKEKAWASSPIKWTQHAPTRILGNPSIIPGTVVDVQSSGSSVVEHDYDGYWLVRGVEHVLTAKSFQSLLTLARPEGVTNKAADYRPFWSVSPQGRPQVVRKGDVWESSWKSVSTVSSHLVPAKSTTANTLWKVPQ